MLAGNFLGVIIVLLVLRVVYFYPVAVRVLKINLLYAVYAIGNGIRLACPVFESDIILFQSFDELVYGRDAEAEVCVFVVGGGSFGAGDDMEVALFAHAEPGMAAVVEGFGDGVEADDVCVEVGGDFEVEDV